MAAAFAAAAVVLEPDVRLGKVDTEAEPGIAGRYGIRSIPTLVLLRKGREVGRHSGALSTGAIVERTRQALRAEPWAEAAAWGRVADVGYAKARSLWTGPLALRLLGSRL